MIDLQTYGWQDCMLPENADVPRRTDCIPARVMAGHRERYEVVCTYGVTYGRLKTSIYYGQGADFPTVGDFVLLDYQPEGDSLIVGTLPRRSFFSRRSKERAGNVEAEIAMCGHVFGDLMEQELAELERIAKPGGMMILCPGNVDADNDGHQFLIGDGYEWGKFLEPGETVGCGWKRKYWRTKS
jgi:hypothetical protein